MDAMEDAQAIAPAAPDTTFSQFARGSPGKWCCIAQVDSSFPPGRSGSARISPFV